ncbi:hypothetical protein BS17DRAFT_800648, partial [Gyrodon lividus]
HRHPPVPVLKRTRKSLRRSGRRHADCFRLQCLYRNPEADSLWEQQRSSLYLLRIIPRTPRGLSWLLRPLRESWLGYAHFSGELRRWIRGPICR